MMKNSHTNHIEKICVNASTEELVKVREAIGRYTIDLGFSEERTFKIQLVVDEICSNIIKHAYQNESSQSNLKICLELTKNKNGLKIKIFDQGPPFNPIEYNSPDIQDHIRHPHKGGLGIPLIKLLSDKISYHFAKDDKSTNMLIIEFNLN